MELHKENARLKNETPEREELRDMFRCQSITREHNKPTSAAGLETTDTRDPPTPVQEREAPSFPELRVSVRQQTSLYGTYLKDLTPHPPSWSLQRSQRPVMKTFS